jgi:hypothetical protein
MRLRYERREEVRVDDFNMQKSLTVGIGTDRRVYLCTEWSRSEWERVNEVR